MSSNTAKRLLIEENFSYAPAKEPIFYSAIDEQLFYWRLGKIKCVKRYERKPNVLVIELIDEPLDDDALYDLVSLYFRYNLDMTKLAFFGEDPERKWFKSSHRYWHARVYGPRNRKKT